MAHLYRVKLRQSTGDAKQLGIVEFRVTPDLVETRNVNYKTVDPVHAPGQIFAYANTSSRVFNMSNIRFVSRTQIEADENLVNLWLLRSWCMPEFGRSSLNPNQEEVRRSINNTLNTLSTQQRQTILSHIQQNSDAQQAFRSIAGTEFRGQPPHVLTLSAYADESQGPQSGSGVNRFLQHINRVPVVIQQLSIPYPSDVDYIPSSAGVPMPTIMSLDLTLAETHSPSEYERFSLSSFKQGILAGF